MLVNK